MYKRIDHIALHVADLEQSIAFYEPISASKPTLAELMRVISALSKISENDLAAVCGVVPGTGPLLNIQQLIGHGGTTGIAQRLALPDRQDKESNPIQNASQVLESFELLNKFIKEKTVIEDAIESKSRHIGDQPEPK